MQTMKTCYSAFILAFCLLQTDGFNLTVSEPVGGSARLPCGQDGHAHSPAGTWTYKGATVLTWSASGDPVFGTGFDVFQSRYQFSSADKSLTILEIQESDLGVYNCEDTPTTVDAIITLEAEDDHNCPYWGAIIGLCCGTFGFSSSLIISSLCRLCCRKREVYNTESVDEKNVERETCRREQQCTTCCCCSNYWSRFSRGFVHLFFWTTFVYILLATAVILWGVSTTDDACGFTESTSGKVAFGLSIGAAALWFIGHAFLAYCINRSKQTSREKMWSLIHHFLFITVLPVMAFLELAIYCVNKDSPHSLLMNTMGYPPLGKDQEKI